MVVTKKRELVKALMNKEETIIVQGKLAKTLSPIFKNSQDVNVKSGMKKREFLVAVGAAGVDDAVIIVAIITVGIVVLISLFLGYNAKIKSGEHEIIFEKK